MVEPLTKKDILTLQEDKSEIFSFVEVIRVVECVQALKERERCFVHDKSEGSCIVGVTKMDIDELLGGLEKCIWASVKRRRGLSVKLGRQSSYKCWVCTRKFRRFHNLYNHKCEGFKKF